MAVQTEMDPTMSPCSTAPGKRNGIVLSQRILTRTTEIEVVMNIHRRGIEITDRNTPNLWVFKLISLRFYWFLSRWDSMISEAIRVKYRM